MTHAAARLPSRHFGPEAQKSPSGRWKLGLIGLIAALVAGFTLGSIVWKSDDSVTYPAEPSSLSNRPVALEPVAPESLAVTEVAPALIENVPAPAATTSLSQDIEVMSPAAAESQWRGRSDELSPSLGGVERIEDIDLTKLPDLVAFASTTGGVINLKEAQYADLTGDRSDEAIVAISSSGTFGNLGYFVVTLTDGWPAIIWQAISSPSSRNGIDLRIENGGLVETMGVYGAEDPSCCPSLLQRTHYVWTGVQFAVSSQQLISSGGKTDESE